MPADPAEALEPLLKEVLARVKPSPEEEVRAKEVADRLAASILREAANRGVRCIPLLVGSVAKGTWTRNPDLDVFILFPPDVPRADLEKRGLELARAVMPEGDTKYAEHPYLNGVVEGFDVDIVPCYEIRDPSQRMTAVDRTPFHNEYVMKHLPPGMRDDVRLLKQFMRGAGVYGAEARVEGFSGYMTELLVMRYGGFAKALEEASKWKPLVVLALETASPHRFPESPLVFVDPVDGTRNAAAAVSPEMMAQFSFAAGRFLSAPSLKFFFPPPRRRRTVAETRAEMKRRATHVVAILCPKPDIIDDILFPQGRKAGARIARGLEERGFRVLRWRFGEERPKAGNPLVGLVLELDRKALAAARVHDGPPAWSEHAERFLEKWRASPEAASPPYLDGGKWRVIVRDRVTSARENLLGIVNGADMGKDLAKLLREKGRVVEGTAAARLALVEEMFFAGFPWDA